MNTSMNSMCTRGGQQCEFSYTLVAMALYNRTILYSTGTRCSHCHVLERPVWVSERQPL